MREATRALAELRAEAASESESRARELERARTRESKALQAAEEARQREAEGKDEGREQVASLSTLNPALYTTCTLSLPQHYFYSLDSTCTLATLLLCFLHYG